MKRQHWRGLAACAIGLACIGERANACSKERVPSHRFPRMLAFVGVAMPDTLRAGPGAVRFSSESELAASKNGRIHGQVVRVVRMDPSSPHRLPPLARRDSMDVVVVPWAYDAECTTYAWGRSAHWVAPGTRGLFVGALRDSSQWAEGRPTMDVFNAYATPYTFPPMPAGVTGSRGSLTYDELLDVMSVLPETDVEPTLAATLANVEPLLRWAREHSALAHKPPVVGMISVARWSIEEARVREVASPLAGTYRFTVTSSTGDSVTFFARTNEHAIGAIWGGRPFERPVGVSDSIPPPRGYALLAETAEQESTLAGIDQFSNEGLAAQGFLSITERPLFTSADSTVWEGSVDLFRRGKRIAKGNPSGKFVRYANGDVRFEALVDQNGKEQVAIRGERVSRSFVPKRP